MAPAQVSLSPAELSYLHTSLSQTPPIRPDSRSPTQFRPLVAETDILPSTNGSARICFADGTEAVVGVKAEVEKSRSAGGVNGETSQEGVRGLGTGGTEQEVEMGEGGVDENAARGEQGKGEDSWVEIAIEIPGFRDDDPLPVFLSAMLTEALLADGALKDRLWINRRFHWRLYVDVRLSHGLSLLQPYLRLRPDYMLTPQSGTPPFCTLIIPPSTPLTHNTSCTPPHAPAGAQIRRRRRSAIQRRLGRVCVSLLALLKQAASNAPRNER